jgi:hypothetical protein
MAAKTGYALSPVHGDTVTFSGPTEPAEYALLEYVSGYADLVQICSAANAQRVAGWYDPRTSQLPQRETMDGGKLSLVVGGVYRAIADGSISKGGKLLSDNDGEMTELGQESPAYVLALALEAASDDDTFAIRILTLDAPAEA